MKQTMCIFQGWRWLTAIVVIGFLSACGGGDGGRSTILGVGDISPVVLPPVPGVPPTVTAVAPTLNAVGVPVNTRVITAAFSKAMDSASLNTSSFMLACPASTPISSGVVSYLPASRTASLTLPVNVSLPPDTVCTATVTLAARDTLGLALASNFVWQFTTGVTAAVDTTPPTVTNTINANGATNVAVNTKVGATFSEFMAPSTITATSFTLRQGTNLIPGAITYSGVSAVFTPTSNLAFNTLYTATVTTLATDLAGNPMASDYVWSWTTTSAPDTTAPTVIGTINANGATNVAINTKVGATFSEGMDPLTITNLNFSLKVSSTGANVPGVIDYSGVNAAFAPATNLAPATRYTVTVKGGVGGVEDLAGNPMVNDFSISWTTAALADTTPPSVTLVSPPHLATNVAVGSKVTATFDEAMDPLTINNANFTVAGVIGTVVFDAINKVATFTPATALAKNTSYTATVTRGVADLASNHMANDKVWTFTTEAAVVLAPVIDLLTAAPFGTFGGTAGMTNQGTNTVINGDIGTTATGTSAITGFHDAANIYTQTPSNIGNVTGKIFTCAISTTGSNSAVRSEPDCAAATQARLDAQTAYLALVAKPVGGASPAPGANLSGVTLLPGTYVAPAGTFMIQGGNLTLDAAGDANATWIFQMATTLTVGGPGAAFPRSIILAGGALAKNVFWQVGSAATINAGGGGTMVGTIIAQDGVTFSTAGNVDIVTLNGRALSLGASVTMVNTVINVPAP
jgi:hypothetical protein